jgi:hypothetical protein
MMRVKIFKGATAEGLESEINEWLATIPQGTQIAETQTAVAAAPSKSGARVVDVVVSIWYGDRQDHTKRPL